jgi:hypothetical protein
VAYCFADNTWEADEEFTRAKRKWPKDPENYLAHGKCRMFQKQFEEAITQYDKSISLNYPARYYPLMMKV